MAKQVNYKKIDFVDSPEEITPIDEINLNAMQSNAENAINEVYNELLDSKLNTYVKIIANDILDQAEATEVLNNYEKFENKIIQFTKNGTNKTVLYGYIMEDNNSNKFLVVLDLKGKARQYNKTDYREYNVAYEINEGTVDINNITVNSIGDTAKYVSNLENATSKPEKSSAYGALMVLPFSHTKQIQLYIDVENNKMYTRKVEGSDTRHTFTEWKSFDDIIKALEEKQTATDDEVNQVVGEVSDVKLDIGNLKQEQVLQNKAIQKNVDDILAVDKKATSNTQRTENIERNIFDSGFAEGEAPITVKDSALSEVQEVEMGVAKGQKTTRGVNLFNFNAEPFKIVETRVEKLENGLRLFPKIKNYVYISFQIDIKNNLGKKFIFSAIVKQFNLTSAKFIQLSQRNANEEILLQVISENVEQGVEIQTQNNINYPFLRITLYSNRRDEVIENQYIDYTDMQLEMDKKTPYEEYTGGQASPNPDYPQKINKIDKDFEFKTCGKNLFDIKNFEQAFLTEYEKKYPIKVKENKVFWGGQYKEGPGGGIVFSLNKNLDYSLSFTNKDYVEMGYRIYLCNNIQNSLILDTENVVFGNGGNIKYLFNSKDYKYLVVMCYGAREKTYADNIQLEQNDKATQYEPYIETTTPITLKGNEVLPYDKLAVKYDGGKYKLMLEKNMEKVIFNGSENFGLNQKNQFYLVKGNLDVKNSAKCYSNYFKQTLNAPSNTQNSIFVGTTGNFMFTNVNTPTLQEFKEWVKDLAQANNSLEVIFEKATPEVIQLAEFDNFNLMFNSITNIITSIDNIHLKVKYYRDFITTIRNLQVDSAKVLGLEAQLQELENRVKALEAKQVVEQPLSEEEIPNDNNLRV